MFFQVYTPAKADFTSDGKSFPLSVECRGDISGSRWWGVVTVVQGIAFAGYLFTGGMAPNSHLRAHSYFALNPCLQTSTIHRPTILRSSSKRDSSS